MNALKLVLVIAVLLVLATVAGWEQIEWPFYSGVALLVISWVWSRASLLAVGFRRTLGADRVFAGAPVREEFRITNKSVLPRSWIRVRDHSSLPGYRPSRSVSVGGRAETRWTTEMKPAQRGRYRIGPATLESGDPFGLFESHRRIEPSHELIVYPALVALPDRPALAGDVSGADRRTAGRPLPSPIIRTIRPYVTGDPWNQIAWKASARHASLLVKEFDPDPISDEWVFLDLDPESAGASRDVTEYAVSLATSFALSWLDTGREVGLLVNRTIAAIVEADAGDRQRLQILETLAVVEPFGDADPATLISRFSTRFSRSTGLVVISTGNGIGFAAPLRHLFRLGVPLVVIAVVPHGRHGGPDDWDEIESEGIVVTRMTSEGKRIRRSVDRSGSGIDRLEA